MAIDLSLTRRSLLGQSTLVAGAAALAGLCPSVAFAEVATDRRLVVFVLRGGMDSLGALVPYGDRDYAGLRGKLALAAPGTADGAIDLDGFHGLAPALAPIAPWFKTGELGFVQAVATPYRERSHFDAQDLLENGSAQPHLLSDGWLNRALGTLGPRGGTMGLAVGKTIPLVLRGATPVSSWAPTKLPEGSPQFYEAVSALYRNDAMFGAALKAGLATDKMADGDTAPDMSSQDVRAGVLEGDAKTDPNAYEALLKRARGQVGKLIEASGKLLVDPNGPRVAVVDLPGWDTHSGQGSVQGRLPGALGILANALVTLKDTLGPDVWRKTVVVAVTEFGRTVAVNGTGGTDHGTASVALLAGGAVVGSKVYGSWPGLSQAALYQGRDLKPTTDMRSVLKAVLRDQLRVPGPDLERTVFPNSADAAAFKGLVQV